MIYLDILDSTGSFRCLHKATQNPELQGCQLTKDWPSSVNHLDDAKIVSMSLSNFLVLPDKTSVWRNSVKTTQDEA